METITGFVEHIVYRNEENGYTVLNLASNEEDEVTCVGVFQMISEGESLELTGEYTVHPSYGPQFKVQQYSIKAPEDIASIERYLGSGAIKGVGASLAGRIVKKFREDTFRIIEEEPERLAEVRGISERMAREIAVQVEEKKDMRKAMIYLQKFGISTTLAAKIYQFYGPKTYQVLEGNPYQLADQIQGIGFKIADEIATKIGIHSDSDFRIRSGIFYTLNKLAENGHCYGEREQLVKKAKELLEVELPKEAKKESKQETEKEVVIEEVNKETEVIEKSVDHVTDIAEKASETEDVKESVEESIPAALLTLENSDTSESETKVEQAEAVDSMAVIANKTPEEMTVEELQTAILGKMANNGPVTEDMKRTVAENIWHDSLVNWLKSFR